MFEAIATVRTFNGLIEKSVCQSMDIDFVTQMARFWEEQPSTIFVRIEMMDRV